MQHGTIGRFVFAMLLVALRTTSPAMAIDLSGDYVGFNLVPFTVSVMQTGTVLQMSGHVVSGAVPYQFSASGTVDPSTGAVSVTGGIETLCAEFVFSGTGDGEELTGTATAHCVDGTHGPGPFRLTKCGNGVLDPGENCDPGTATGGDCCSARCRLEPAGTACTGQACTENACDATGSCTHVPAPAGQACEDDFDPCTADVCDGAGTCTHVPVPPGESAAGWWRVTAPARSS